MATLKESIDYLVNKALDSFSGNTYEISSLSSGNVMGVFGSSGGTGVSSFVYEIARLFANDKKKVLIIDGDLLKPIQNIHCEKKTNNSMMDLFIDKCELSDVIKRDNYKIDYLEAVPINIFKMNELDNSPKLYNKVFNKLNTLRKLYDIILIDINVSLSTTPVELAFISFCDFFIQLGDESISSMLNEQISASLIQTVNSNATIISVLNKSHDLMESKLSKKIKLPYDYNFVRATANKFSYLFQGQADNNNLYNAYIELFEEIKSKMSSKGE